MNVISWFSSITTASFISQFANGESLSAHQILLICLAVSHGYFVVKFMLNGIMKSIPSSAEQNIRKEEFKLRSKYLGKRGERGLSAEYIPNPNDNEEMVESGLEMLKSAFKSS